MIAESDLLTGLWPHQQRGVTDTISAIEGGARRLVLTAPCGAGKTRIMTTLINWANDNNMPVALYTVRKMLFQQTAQVLRDNGIEFGCRASGHKPALLKDVQLCMTQSELSAVLKKEKREIHHAKLVLIDELHMQGGGAMQEFINRHVDTGAAVVGFTATPLDLEGQWDSLVQAGTNSELRECGAHAIAYTYCPDVPDLKHIKKYKVGEDLTDAENRTAMMRPGVFGRVFSHWQRLNPERKPTILFGPDVAGSLHFAQEFHSKGVRAAHIDAKQIWVDGQFIESDDENRAWLVDQSERGLLEVLCNRFVLREGIDLPHIAHAIFACVFGSLTTYLQSGGRAIRGHHSLESVVIQDHGGNFLRHGSLNSDRHWELGESSRIITEMRAERMREKPETEPIICPKCNAARLSGPKCHACGYEYQKRSRTVVQIDGTLQQQDGPLHKPRLIRRKPDTERLWVEMYHRARSKKWDATFRQAEANFFRENYYYPPRNLPFMPKEPGDWFRKVRDVSRENLT